MQKLWQIGAALVLLFWGCNQNEKSQDIGDGEQEVLYDYRKLPDRLPLNGEVLTLLEDWEDFSEFSKAFEILYGARTDEDLLLAVEDLLNKTNALEKSEYPETLDRSELKSRQRVFKTFLLKTKADLEGRRDPTASAVEMLRAYNDFRSQMNRIVDNPLDTDLILDVQ